MRHRPSFLGVLRLRIAEPLDIDHFPAPVRGGPLRALKCTLNHARYNPVAADAVVVRGKLLRVAVCLQGFADSQVIEQAIAAFIEEVC